MPDIRAAASVVDAAAQAAAPTRKFGPPIAVDRVTPTIVPGGSLGPIGPSGTGKSTLVNLSATLLPPASGTATAGGDDIVRAPAAVRGRTGDVPQRPPALMGTQGVSTPRTPAPATITRHGERP